MKLNFFALAGVAIYCATPTSADDFIDVQLVDNGNAERIEAAASLRVLSQEAASAACHMVHDINPTEARDLMLEAKTDFHIILDALQFGDEDMHIIGAETRRRTIIEIEAVRESWNPIFEAAATLLDDPHDEAALALIKANNEAVLDETTRLLADIEEEYANPAEISQRDLMLLDFSARQAMLTQKMAKIACEIWVGNRSDDRINELTETMQIYDLTLAALLKGMPEIGIISAPTPEIATAIEQAILSWTTTKAELEAVLANDDVSQELKENLFNDLNLALKEMIHLEHLYVAYSKHEAAT